MSTSPYEAVPPPAPAADLPAGQADRAPAKWWNRVGATLFDDILLGVVGWAFVAVAGIARFGSLAGGAIVALVAFVYAFLMLAYRDGQTLGKQVASIRVLSEDYGPVGLGRAFARELVKVVFGYTGILYLIDVLWPLWQPENRALHDLIAGTRVVRTDGGDPPPPGYYDAGSPGDS
jgi:uncharacterized RDD family membrane protein YckC